MTDVPKLEIRAVPVNPDPNTRGAVTSRMTVTLDGQPLSPESLERMAVAEACFLQGWELWRGADGYYGIAHDANEWTVNVLTRGHETPAAAWIAANEEEE